MRSFRLLTVAVLAVILALSSAQNAFALPQITLNPTCGSPLTEGALGATGTGKLGAWTYSPTIPFLLDAGGVAVDGTYSETWSFTVRTDVPPGLYTITYTDATGSASVTFGIPCPAPVGGFVEPVNKLAIAAPYLALFGVIGTVAVVFWKRPDN